MLDLKSLELSQIENDYLNRSLTSLYKEAKVSYIGNTKQSVKMLLSYKHGVETYCIYLAPANMSGRNVCPNSKHCREHCLNGSGQNKPQILSHGDLSPINISRIKKTDLFFDNKPLFMAIVIKEIIKHRIHAKNNRLGFAIRLNGTSDLSPEDFIFGNKNILQIFNDIQFYDYTKVSNRVITMKLQEKYFNYDLTLSFNGYNWNSCKKYLDDGGKVSVVFKDKLPVEYKGYNVIDANDYDMRYLDPCYSIMGLHYHPTANDLKTGKLIIPKTRFIVE